MRSANSLWALVFHRAAQFDALTIRVGVYPNGLRQLRVRLQRRRYPRPNTQLAPFLIRFTLDGIGYWLCRVHDRFCLFLDFVQFHAGRFGIALNVSFSAFHRFGANNPPPEPLQQKTADETPAALIFRIKSSPILLYRFGGCLRFRRVVQ